ncbi:unnamed protein product [Allacma fusca]|uniref:Uncharacterized protein n=1 Tax=Allacma fusca TaxID=39272 RepID=A0A8J2LNS7_9HEXA|nr:unnamed protein product [Allacma fusca]
MFRTTAILLISSCILGIQSYPKGKSEMGMKSKEVRMEAMTEMPMMVSTMASDMITSTPEAKALSGSSEIMPMQDDMASTMSSMDMAITTEKLMTKGNMGKMEGKHKHRKN